MAGSDRQESKVYLMAMLLNGKSLPYCCGLALAVTEFCFYFCSESGSFSCRICYLSLDSPSATSLHTVAMLPYELETITRVKWGRLPQGGIALVLKRTLYYFIPVCC